MPIPSAAEMNPSDGGLAVFGRVTLGVVVALALGGAISMAILMVPGSASDVLGGAGIGALIGTMTGVVVAPSTGILAALARHWVRESRRRALLAGVGVWLVWVVVAALTVGVGLRFPLNLWGNIWPFLPALAVALGAALLLANRVHHSADPLTPEEVRAEERRRREALQATRRGGKGRKKSAGRS
ncbi:hypothetical protein IPV09_01790 [Tessaracoccus sp. SD287]|uniref:hypothetical protein n=1 Tax=Tessaracoccus sp. SD287 TaxID=2782008 RepID=UPI001A96F98A|nr:hypothetical protein [Tessaracoccus sp. SD287]MBO1030064.1 hypothetical protein [Tessaracoccus sp. SD287]